MNPYLPIIVETLIHILDSAKLTLLTAAATLDVTASGALRFNIRKQVHLFEFNLNLFLRRFETQPVGGRPGQFEYWFPTLDHLQTAEDNTPLVPIDNSRIQAALNDTGMLMKAARILLDSSESTFPDFASKRLAEDAVSEALSALRTLNELTSRHK